MFLEISKIPIEPLKEKIVMHFKHKPTRELNYIYDHNQNIACFIQGAKKFTGLFCVTDSDFSPFICYQTKSYVNACTISDSGKYAVVQTANNSKNDEDCGAFIILELERRVEISKFKVPFDWQCITHLFIDENKKSFVVYCDSENAEYDFHGNLLSGKIETSRKKQRQRQEIPDWEKELDKKNKAKAGIMEE